MYERDAEVTTLPAARTVDPERSVPCAGRLTMRKRRAPGVTPGSLHAGRAGRTNVCDARVTVDAWPAGTSPAFTGWARYPGTMESSGSKVRVLLPSFPSCTTSSWSTSAASR